MISDKFVYLGVVKPCLSLISVIANVLVITDPGAFTRIKVSENIKANQSV